ncbi:MAG TPA: hypothetical protein VLH39_01855 [Magnetospirillaceae bacterium]|nr:hypothetical protein [Magnetospirillaceae bacterium]
MNLGSTGILFLAILPQGLGLSVGGPWIFAVVLVQAVYLTVCAAALRDAAESRSVTLAGFCRALGEQWAAGLVLGLVLILLAALLLAATSFYQTVDGFLAWFAAGSLFWSSALVLLALQWYPAVRALLPGAPVASLRQCFSLMFDNLGFSVFLAVYTLAGLVLSAFTAFLIPGIAGAALGYVDALKLLLRKYEWLQANPGSGRRRIPWADILAEDMELVGKRTLKGMIFPWKE